MDMDVPSLGKTGVAKLSDSEVAGHRGDGGGPVMFTGPPPPPSRAPARHAPRGDTSCKEAEGSSGRRLGLVRRGQARRGEPGARPNACRNRRRLRSHVGLRSPSSMRATRRLCRPWLWSGHRAPAVGLPQSMHGRSLSLTMSRPSCWSPRAGTARGGVEVFLGERSTLLLSRYHGELAGAGPDDRAHRTRSPCGGSSVRAARGSRRRGSAGASSRRGRRPAAHGRRCRRRGVRGRARAGGSG